MPLKVARVVLCLPARVALWQRRSLPLSKLTLLQVVWAPHDVAPLVPVFNRLFRFHSCGESAPRTVPTQSLPFHRTRKQSPWRYVALPGETTTARRDVSAVASSAPCPMPRPHFHVVTEAGG